MSRFVFLDRDGTLVEDRGYTHRVEDYRLLPGVVEGLRRLAAGGYRLAIVTNQSGIGRGYFGVEEFERFQRRLLDDLARHGVAIERTYFCPHRPDEGCTCRKPGDGLLSRAREELGADLGASWVIGDTALEVELARRAGCRGAVLVLTGKGAEASRSVAKEIPRASDLVAAAEAIMGGPPPSRE